MQWPIINLFWETGINGNAFRTSVKNNIPKSRDKIGWFTKTEGHKKIHIDKIMLNIQTSDQHIYIYMYVHVFHYEVISLRNIIVKFANLF